MGSLDELSAFPEPRLSSLVSALCLHQREQGRVCVSPQPELGGCSAAQSPGHRPRQSPRRKRAAAMREACCALARACGSQPPRRPCHLPRSSCPGRDTCQAVWGVLGLHPSGGWGVQVACPGDSAGTVSNTPVGSGRTAAVQGDGFSRREGLTGPFTPLMREQQLSTEAGAEGAGGLRPFPPCRWSPRRGFRPSCAHVHARPCPRRSRHLQRVSPEEPGWTAEQLAESCGASHLVPVSGLPTSRSSSLTRRHPPSGAWPPKATSRCRHAPRSTHHSVSNTDFHVLRDSMFPVKL